MNLQKLVFLLKVFVNKETIAGDQRGYFSSNKAIEKQTLMQFFVVGANLKSLK